MTKYHNTITTPKQKKFIAGMVDNMSKLKDIKTEKQIALEAGYSKSMAKHPITIKESPAVKEGLASLLSQLDEKRRSALNHISEKKLEKSAGRDLAYIHDILTKNHQLLGGGATERIQITEEDKKAVDEAFEQ